MEGGKEREGDTDGVRGNPHCMLDIGREFFIIIIQFQRRNKYLPSLLFLFVSVTC